MEDKIYIKGDYDLRDIYKKYCKWDNKFKQWYTTTNLYELLKEDLEHLKYYQVPYCLKDEFDQIGKWKGKKGYYIPADKVDEADELLKSKIVKVPYNKKDKVKKLKSQWIEKDQWKIYQPSFKEAEELGL